MPNINGLFNVLSGSFGVESSFYYSAIKANYVVTLQKDDNLVIVFRNKEEDVVLGVIRIKENYLSKKLKDRLIKSGKWHILR